MSTTMWREVGEDYAGYLGEYYQDIALQQSLD